MTAVTAVHVGRQVRHYRVLRGYLQAELGARIGRTKSVISRIENGQGAISLPLFLRLAQALGVPPMALLPDVPWGVDERKIHLLVDVMHGCNLLPEAVLQALAVVVAALVVQHLGPAPAPEVEGATQGGG